MITFNQSRFAHETIDGETMVIDTMRGHLLIFGGSGSFILQRVCAGASRESLLRDIDNRYGHDASEGARVFLDELMATEVLVTKERSLSPDDAAADPVSSDIPVCDWPSNFDPPVIERYEDIAEIIAMDPIHDVGAAGWPTKAV